MKDKSEFAQILEQKVRAVGHAPQRPSCAKPGTSSGAIAEDWMTKIFFNQGPVRAPIFAAYGQAAANTAEKFQNPNKASTATPGNTATTNVQAKFKTEPGAVFQSKLNQAPEPKPEPVLRVKRKLTFDQSLALKTFARFGESDINEYSTDLELKTAYRKLAKRFHPDAGAISDENFKIISKAYQKLVA